MLSIMIHVIHTAHQGQKKVFIRNVDTDLVVLTVATVNELDFWECAHSCPLYCFLYWTRTIKSTSNDTRLELAMIQLLVSMVK